MQRCKNNVELAMTGINAPAEIVAMADYVTKLEQEKHPYYNGMRARKGIEYQALKNIPESVISVNLRGKPLSESFFIHISPKSGF